VSEPAIPISNLYYLFCYAWNRFEEARAISTGAEDSSDLPNLLARVLVTGVRSLLRRGLDRNYLPLQEELRTVRGHIELGPTLRLQARSAKRIVCSYDELSHDLLHNQIIKATLRRLLKIRSLDPTLAREIQILILRMPDVTDIGIKASAFARVQLHRNNARYDLLLKICELVFDSLIPAKGGSGYAFQDVLRDERKMARVFEDFVRNFYRASQRVFQVKPLQLAWQAVPLSSGGLGRLPVMRSDVYLDSGRRRIIIDTKYYAEAMQERFGSVSFRSDNLYQLFAYLRNDAASRPQAIVSEGVLLYPQVKHEFDAAYDIHGHRVRLYTVDLAQPWRSIEDRLSYLIGEQAQA